MIDSQEEKQYWKQNMRLILALLSVWAFVSLGAGIVFVKFFNQVPFFNLPFGFWMAQQGAIFIFVLLIFIYAWRMDKIDHQHHLDE
ncbi:MAG: DUF4212 domain-containing protein [Candidatus Hydrogenedentes bacterium]|nr:DUF4212 domain-containing protein [Candidatus Hydrogenedentota bacterium]